MTPDQLAQSNSESGHQKALFCWAALETNRHPELNLMFAIPNGSLRTAITGARLKAEGTRAGVPDLFLPAARGTWHGLFVELKRPGGVPTKEQMNWIDKLLKQNYYAVVCYGWEEAKTVILEYLRF